MRFIGASNYDAALLSAALEAADARGLPRYQTLQNEYNLYTRDRFEGPVQELVLREGLSVITYYSLASGFLSGKYRSKDDLGQSPRGGRVGNYLDDRGMRVLAALDTVAARTGAALPEIALAWLAAQPGVAAPIASATSLAQMESLMKGVRLQLEADDLALLKAAGA